MWNLRRRQIQIPVAFQSGADALPDDFIVRTHEPVIEEEFDPPALRRQSFHGIPNLVSQPRRSI